MKRLIPSIGVLGGGLAVAGLVAYTIAPDKLWVATTCLGLALVCLILFFVVHFEAVKAFSTRRSTRLGANSILMVVLVLGILIIANFLAARHSHRWDLSETQHFTLSPQTIQVLRGLSREVKVTVFSQDQTQGSRTYHDVLEGYRGHSDKLKIKYVDPDKDPMLTRQYGISRADTAVIESSTQTTRITTPSEAEITGALIRVSKDAKKKVLFLEGHGERGIMDQDRGGLSRAKEALVKQGYEVGALSLLQETAVPIDVAVLAIPGPRRPVIKEEKERIGKFVADGGRLLILLDPDTQADLDDLLAQWGIEPGRGVLVDLQDRLAMGDLTALMVRTFTEHEITQDFNFAVLFPVSRHLVFHEDKGKEWEFVPLARTSARSWAETDLQGNVVSFSEKDDIKGPLPLAGALTPKKAPEEGKRRAAIVIVGNSQFASNGYVTFPGNTDFLLHALGWLAEERDLISITPKEPAFRPFIPSPAQERMLLYVQVFALPLLTFIWGITVWRRRRRL